MTQVESTQSGSEAENLIIVQRYFKAVQTGDLETLGALIAPDVVWHQPGSNKFSGTHKGAQAVFGMIGGMMEASAGTFKIDAVKSLKTNGSNVAAVISFSGQRDGAEMSMEGVDIIRVMDGLIKEVWLYSENQNAEDYFWG